MSKKEVKKNSAIAKLDDVQAPPEPEVVSAPKKKRRKSAPTQKEVDEGVETMQQMQDELRSQAAFLHGRVQAGFAMLGLAASIRRSGGSMDVAMTSIDALHDDWISQAMQSIHAFEEITGESFSMPCNECGGPTCEDHESSEPDMYHHTCGEAENDE